MQPPTCYNLSMNAFAPYGIIILAALILASFQLVPGIFALFSHYTLGKFSKPKASRLSLFFILGVETINTCLFVSIYYLASIVFLGDTNLICKIIGFILAGIFIALAMITFFFYYRPGKGSELFVPRKYAEALRHNAKSAKLRLDAFLLGIVSSTCELVFTLPLFIISIIMTFMLDHSPISFLLILAPLVPLLYIHFRFQAGQNLADIIKSRIKSKTFFRIFISLCYILIATIIIYLELI